MQMTSESFQEIGIKADLFLGHERTSFRLRPHLRTYFFQREHLQNKRTESKRRPGLRQSGNHKETVVFVVVIIEATMISAQAHLALALAISCPCAQGAHLHNSE
jgi:hypothetical protein